MESEILLWNFNQLNYNTNLIHAELMEYNYSFVLCLFNNSLFFFQQRFLFFLWKILNNDLRPLMFFLFLSFECRFWYWFVLAQTIYFFSVTSTFNTNSTIKKNEISNFSFFFTFIQLKSHAYGCFIKRFRSFPMVLLIHSINEFVILV